MIVYKFGGASVKDADSVSLLQNIISKCPDDLIVVISAMGKTTNKLEGVVESASKGGKEYVDQLSSLKDYHMNISRELILDPSNPVFDKIEAVFKEIDTHVKQFREEDFNLFYDQVVSFGEILSTSIVSHYLEYKGLNNKWVDIRKVFQTDDNYRDAGIDFINTRAKCEETFTFKGCTVYLTQGFIGTGQGGKYTTLGREGSDYSAAVLANFLDAQNVILWKDVAGIFNADPARFKEVTLLEKIRYQEMIELAFYGAKVIHPKTLKPLKDKLIPLYIKSFYDPEKTGTIVGEFNDKVVKVPVIILKDNQVLVSISLKDLSFISEDHISKLFSLLDNFRLKANLIQHSAVSFSVCVDAPRGQEVEELISILRGEFKVLYNDGLNLLTIRNYTEEDILIHTANKKVLVEQRSRNMVQFVTD